MQCNPARENRLTDFTVLEDPPVLPTSVPGLHFKFSTDDLGSLSRGTSIYYKRIPVGKVQAYHLDESGKQIIIDAYIEEQYAHLVRHNTRFWNTSGIDLTGSVAGFRLRTESAASIISGGIAFATPDNKPSGAAAKNGSTFTLYPDYDSCLGERYPVWQQAQARTAPERTHHGSWVPGSRLARYSIKGLLSDRSMAIDSTKTMKLYWCN